MYARKLLALTLLIVPFLQSPAHAHPHQYYGGGLQAFDHEERGGEFGLNAAYGRFGFAEFEKRGIFQGEIRLGGGVGSDEDMLTTGDGPTLAEVKLQGLFGAYILASLPMSAAFRPYALLGYSLMRANARSCSMTADLAGIIFCAEEDDNITDVSFGFGADLRITRHWRVNVEYANYVDQDTAKINGLSIGFTLDIPRPLSWHDLGHWRDDRRPRTWAPQSNKDQNCWLPAIGCPKSLRGPSR